MKQSKQSKLLPILAAVVLLAAAAVVLLPRLLPSASTQQQTGAGGAAAITIDAAAVGTTASFYDCEVDGTTVEVLAVKAGDGTVRLALNTCQVCNGSPYAYFVQQGDYFICQNCGNAFSSDEIGLSSFGCNPVPVTESDYTVDGDTITVTADFLKENASRFTNWKHF